MKLAAALTLGITFVAASASASTVSIYKPGCGSPGSPTLDAFDNAIACSAEVTWTDVVGPGPIGAMSLSIVAEGVDNDRDSGYSEHDAVYVNDVFIGYLTQQGFYSPLFNINPGPGALDLGGIPVTALTTSTFDVTPFLVTGVNTFKVVVDSANWVNEVEVASLAPTPVPEPATIGLLGTGLAAAWRARRRRRERS